jgi:ribosomal protein L37AE/L43A
MPSPLVLKPDPTDRRPDRYIVTCEGKEVGQIFDRVPGASAPRDATWLWSINDKRRVPGSQGGAGDAATREAAMAAFRAAWNALGDRQDHFHDCPHCEGKANIPVQGRPAFKCTRCGKVTAEAELRRLSLKRAPAEDD